MEPVVLSFVAPLVKGLLLGALLLFIYSKVKGIGTQEQVNKDLLASNKKQESIDKVPDASEDSTIKDLEDGKF